MTSPRSTTATVWQQVQELVSESARTQLRLAKQYVEVTQRMAKWPDSDALGRLRSEGERYLRELADLNLSYARMVQDLARESGERLVEAATGERPREDVRSGVRLALDLSGPRGGQAAGGFTVANTRAETARVSLEASAFRPAGGGRAVRLPVTFDPAGFDLAPGAETDVRIAVGLGEEQVEAGRTYHGEVRVLGGVDVVLEVTLHVLAPKPAAPRAAGARTTSPRKATKRSASARRTPPPPA